MSFILHKGWVIALIVIGFLIILGAYGDAGVANEGPILAIFGAFLGICARVLQAEIHQKENKEISTPGAGE